MTDPKLIEALYDNRALVAEVNVHNSRVIVARRRGEEAPPYRNALAEVAALQSEASA